MSGEATPFHPRLPVGTVSPVSRWSMGDGDVPDHAQGDTSAGNVKHVFGQSAPRVKLQAWKRISSTNTSRKVRGGHTPVTYGQRHWGHLEQQHPEGSPGRAALKRYKYHGTDMLNMARGAAPTKTHHTYDHDADQNFNPIALGGSVQHPGHRGHNWVKHLQQSHQAIGHLDHALSQSRTPHALTVFRGVTGDLGTHLHELHRAGKLHGHTVHENSYASTSISPHRALKFADEGHDMPPHIASRLPHSKDGVVMHIKVPKGAHGAYIDGMDLHGDGHKQGLNEEAEMLLPRNRRYKIVGSHVHHDENGRPTLHVHAELHNPTEHPAPVKLHEGYKPLLRGNFHNPEHQDSSHWHELHWHGQARSMAAHYPHHDDFHAARAHAQELGIKAFHAVKGKSLAEAQHITSAWHPHTGLPQS